MDLHDRIRKSRAAFSQRIGSGAARKLKARKSVSHTIWYGLGMMGLIGWSVAIPALLGAALGFWLDKQHLGRYSWTLTLMLIGLLLGCLNAWHWVDKEDRKMREEREDTDA